MKKKTYYHIILDQSGSMHNCISSTINGFNEQVQVVQSLQERYTEQELFMGLTRFNHDVLQTAFAASPNLIQTLTPATYRPSSSTALYDAIGLTVQRLLRYLNGELKDPSTTVVIVILTDGHENASTIFSHQNIQSMIKELEQTGQWTFSYLGATIDAVKVAESLNIKSSNSMFFEKSQITRTYDNLKESLTSYIGKKQMGEDLINFLKKK
jgi:hypothetical protein